MPGGIAHSHLGPPRPAIRPRDNAQEILEFFWPQGPGTVVLPLAVKPGLVTASTEGSRPGTALFVEVAPSKRPPPAFGGGPDALRPSWERQSKQGMGGPKMMAGETPMDDSERLSDLLLDAEEILEAGGEPSPVELCRHHPHLLVEFTRKLAALRATRWLNRPLDSQPPADLASGSVMVAPEKVLAGRYLLEKLLGQGGHGQVWRAWDIELGRPVALKLPRAAGEKADEAMLAEARRVAALKHPGIVPVHDVGRDGETRFIVAELVEGGSLADLPKGAYARERILGWMVEVAEGLDYAHRLGVIHRDIKPANILLDHHGRALLADFGISHSLSARGDAPAPGSITGTLRYMSPGQVKGQAATPQSDIHALGVTLHELLTGKLPYRDASGKDPIALRDQIVAGALEIDPSLPGPIRAVCSRALGLAGHAPFQTAGEMAEAIRRLLQGGRGRRRLATAGLLLGVLALGFTAPGLWGRFTGLGPAAAPGKPALDAKWAESFRALPAEEQSRELARALRVLNPGFDGQVGGELVDGKLAKVTFCTDQVSDIAPLSALDHLRHLEMTGTFGVVGNGILEDLTPIRGMGIKTLVCKYNASLRDLGPLRGMPLETLDLWRTAVDDLGPLAGCPIQVIGFGFCGVTSLEPLRGMPMWALRCSNCGVTDLEPIRDMPMTDLRCHDTPIASLEPVRGKKLKILEMQRTRISSLEPLRGMESLYFLNCFLAPVTDIQPLTECRGLRILFTSHEIERDNPVFQMIPSLRHLNDNTVVDNSNR